MLEEQILGLSKMSPLFGDVAKAKSLPTKYRPSSHQLKTRNK